MIIVMVDEYDMIKCCNNGILVIIINREGVRKDEFIGLWYNFHKFCPTAAILLFDKVIIALFISQQYLILEGVVACGSRLNR